MLKRKLSSLLLLSLATATLASCSNKQTLLFLNWGEYIDEEMLAAFEEKYNCTVSMDLGDSNEIFYSKVRGGTTVYDVVCPSDYMVEKMYMNDMLERIDFSKLTLSEYNPDSLDVRVGVKSIFNDMNNNLKMNLGESYTDGDIKNYCVPYLWGTWGIMYTTEKEGLEQAVTKNENQWASLFDRNSLPSGTRVAMYDSHQHAYYAASRYLEKADPLSVDYGVELSNSDLYRIQTLIKDMGYDAWGTDSIKKDIVAGNIDVGFMWTGDFLYYYCESAAEVVLNAYQAGDVTIDKVYDMMVTITDSSKRVYEANGNTYEIGFDCFIPDDTIAFCDNLAITKDSSNKDLAYKFVDFMSSYQTSSELDEDGNEIDVSGLEFASEGTYTPAYTNTYYVCYDAVTNKVYDSLVDLKNYEYTDEDKDTFTEEMNDGTDPLDSTLYALFYDTLTGLAFEKYYPKDTTKGEILATFSRTYINQINATFNNARA